MNQPNDSAASAPAATPASVPTDPPTSKDNLVTFAGGVAARVGQADVRIKLPAAPTIEQVDRVISALDRIFNRTPPEADWIVDVSAQTRLPLLVLGSLLSYRDALALRGRAIRLQHLPEGTMPPNYFERLRQLFVMEDR
jgi:hypothetical protein